MYVLFTACVLHILKRHNRQRKLLLRKHWWRVLGRWLAIWEWERKPWRTATREFVEVHIQGFHELSRIVARCSSVTTAGDNPAAPQCDAGALRRGVDD